jgi:hypothetical protein
MQILETSCCTTLDTVESGADDITKEEAKDSLHDAAEEGNIDTVKPLLERGMAHSSVKTYRTSGTPDMYKWS